MSIIGASSTLMIDYRDMHCILTTLLILYTYVCLPLLYLCAQDEMNSMRQEHEKELQKFEVDKSKLCTGLM